MDFKKGVGHFIVKVPQRYDEDLGVKGHDGKQLKRASKWNEFDNAVKQAEVIAAPDGAEPPVGSTLYYHDMIVNKQSSGQFHIKDDYFRVPYNPRVKTIDNLAYGYKHKGKFYPLGGWFFVEPIKEELETTKSGLIIVEDIEGKFHKSGEQKPMQQYGKVAFVNEYVKQGYGIDIGDIVFTKKDTEYPFDIDGKTYYRVHERFLLAKTG